MGLLPVLHGLSCGVAGYKEQEAVDYPFDTLGTEFHIVSLATTRMAHGPLPMDMGWKWLEMVSPKNVILIDKVCSLQGLKNCPLKNSHERPWLDLSIIQQASRCHPLELSSSSALTHTVITHIFEF